jgi:tetratricopeptide (TPR) repeat protein
MVAWLYVMSRCFPQSVLLTIFPMVEPEAAVLNLKGINQSHVGEWEAALESLQSALRVNSLLVEAYFNAARILYQLDRRQEARQHFQ